MAKYQRGMVVKAKTTAKSVDMYTRRMGVSAATSSRSTPMGTRGVTSSIRTTATSVAAGTRSVTSSIQATATSVPAGTRGMTVAARVTSKTVKIYTRRIVQTREVEKSDTSPGARGMREQKESEDSDPWGNYRFALIIADEEVGYFSECSGLKTSAEVFEIQEGGLNGRTHKRVGQSKWENIVLRYGTSADNRLLKWRDQYLRDEFTKELRLDPVKSSGAIVLMNNAGEVLRRYEFKNAWPVSWEGPSLSSEGSAVAMESIELAHEGLTIVEGDNSPMQPSFGR